MNESSESSPHNRVALYQETNKRTTHNSCCNTPPLISRDMHLIFNLQERRVTWKEDNINHFSQKRIDKK